LGPDRAESDIEQVGDGLEGEERDADGQMDGACGQVCQAEGGEEGVEIVDEKVGVLEIRQQEEIDADPPGEKDRFPHPASRVLQETAHDEVETDGSEHDQDIPSLTPGVEQQARQQQQDIRQTALADESQGEHGRQEEKEKGDGGEDHGRWLSETRTEFPGRSGRMAKTAGVSGALKRATATRPARRTARAGAAMEVGRWGGRLLLCHTF
jgi:hypothetical protein